MKKKNLIILLVFPFLIAVFCIITVNTTYNKIDVDISYIDWEYNDMEGFQISDALYPLKAQGVNQRHYKVSGDGELVWTLENRNPSDTEVYAEIVEKGDQYFLKAIKEGEVIITCSNKKGNVYRQMIGVIYKDAAILLYPTIGGSQTNIDTTVYYGEYDHDTDTPATIEMQMFIVPDSAAEEVEISCTDNISFDPDTAVISIEGTGAANLTLTLESGLAAPRAFDFEIVDEGVNVYTYDDLLRCTNRSRRGEIVVLRKSFESLDNAYLFDADGNPIKSGDSYRTRENNIECFGNYDAKTGKFSFEDEIYTFTTTYNKNYIDQWNEFVADNPEYSGLTDQVKVGLHVQKDFYGNGYTLNLHNLTYPYAYLLMTNDAGETVRIPELRSDNLFRGPLMFYALGDPNNTPAVALYGQDNIGMYVDGDGITINDVNIKNCEFGDRLANLSTVGTVLEVNGDDVTVKNSRLSNGRNVIRAFSSMNFTLSNSFLSHAQNFLVVTGSNEYVPVDPEATATFAMMDGSMKAAVIKEFLKPAQEGEDNGDTILNDFIFQYYPTSEEQAKIRQSLSSIQNALNDVKAVQNKFMGSTEIKDCYFYQSGISAICMETLFNSTFLETASPSELSGLINTFGLAPYIPEHVSGISYPVKLNISGDTRFYDYKVAENIEFGGLIKENLSGIANSLDITVDGKEVTVDLIFPLKRHVVDRASSVGAVKIDSDNGKKYVNVPVAFYGGGVNLSEVTLNNYENKSNLTAEVEVNLLDSALSYKGSSDSGKASMMKALALKTVVTVTGYEPFSFRFVKGGYLYGETPKVTDLIDNVKGE